MHRVQFVYLILHAIRKVANGRLGRNLIIVIVELKKRR
jgi:hypothetical protein